MPRDFNLSQTISWETESKAFRKSNVNTLTKSAPESKDFSQKCWFVIRAIVVLWSALYANWSGLIDVFSKEESSSLHTSLSKILMMILVKDIGRSWSHDSSGLGSGIGTTSAIFQRWGVSCLQIELLKILVMSGARWWAKSHWSQYGRLSGPDAVLFWWTERSQTSFSHTVGIYVSSGIITRSGAT